MMQALLRALQARFTAASLASTITGGLWLDMAPEGTAMPYATVRVPASPVTQIYGSGGYAEPAIDFIVTGIAASASLLACEALMTAYRDQILTLANGQMTTVLQKTEPMTAGEFPYKDEQGRDCYDWIVSFQYATA